MCKASCSKIIESLYLKRETRNHPLATLAPWNMLPPLLSSKRFQLLSLILCYFFRPSYLVRMNCTAFCGVTKPPNLTAFHGWMLWGLVKCWARLCRCTSRSSGSEDIGMQKSLWVFILVQGALDLSSSLSFCLFFTSLVALLAQVTEWLLTTQQTLCCFEVHVEAELRSPGEFLCMQPKSLTHISILQQRQRQLCLCNQLLKIFW